MLLSNTETSYGWVSIVIHWLMAVVVMGMFALGVYMVELNYMNDWYKTVPYMHQSIGMLLLFLLLFRLFWRLINPLPVILGNPMEKVLALWVHRMHYLWMFVIMLSGYVMLTAGGRGVEVLAWFEVPAVFPVSKGREDIAGLVHMIVAWGFMAFVALHAAAALKHHFIDKDSTLLRMLGVKKGD